MGVGVLSLERARTLDCYHHKVKYVPFRLRVEPIYARKAQVYDHNKSQTIDLFLPSDVNVYAYIVRQVPETTEQRSLGDVRFSVSFLS